MFWSTWWNGSSARFSCEPFVVFSFACLNWKQNGIIWKTQKQHKKMWTIFQCCVNLCSRRRPASPSARQPCALAFFFSCLFVRCCDCYCRTNGMSLYSWFRRDNLKIYRRINGASTLLFGRWFHVYFIFCTLLLLLRSLALTSTNKENQQSNNCRGAAWSRLMRNVHCFFFLCVDRKVKSKCDQLLTDWLAGSLTHAHIWCLPMTNFLLLV